MEEIKENKPIKIPSKNNKQKKKKKKRIILLISIGILLLIIIAVIISSRKEKVIEVQTEKVAKRNITQLVTATGKIQSEIHVNISAEVSGEIVSLPFDEGDEVKKGDLIVKIKPDVYYPQIRQQQAAINVHESNLKAQDVALRKHQLELSRIKELYSKGLASQSDLDNAQNNYDATLASMNTIRAQINQQRANLSAVQYDMSKTTIYAPMSGTITQKNNEKGEKVLGTMSNMGSNIMTISDLSKMECQVEVGETDVSFINLGDTARIEVDAFPDRIFTGYVYEIANSAKTKGTGTQEEVVNFIVKIRIINNDVDLRPGMSCTVDIEVEKKENVLSVPIQSVTTREEDTVSFSKTAENEDRDENLSRKNEDKILRKIKPREIVFIVENGAAKKKVVRTGISDDTYIEISDGLSEDMEVVKGSFKAINKELEEDTKVKINNERKKFKKENE